MGLGQYVDKHLHEQMMSKEKYIYKKLTHELLETHALTCRSTQESHVKSKAKQME